MRGHWPRSAASMRRRRVRRDLKRSSTKAAAFPICHRARGNPRAEAQRRISCRLQAAMRSFASLRTTSALIVVRTRHALHVASDIPGLLQAELGMLRIDAARHVATDEAHDVAIVVHAGAVIEAVGTPQRREEVAARVARRTHALAKAVGLMADRAHRGEDLGAAARVGRQRPGWGGLALDRWRLA